MQWRRYVYTLPRLGRFLRRSCISCLALLIVLVLLLVALLGFEIALGVHAVSAETQPPQHVVLVRGSSAEPDATERFYTP